jgi:arylsulfatase A-like enzyme
VTLAEVLRDHGYTTGALVDNIHLSESFNFHQGFDTFRFLRPEWPLRPGDAGFRLAAYGGARLLIERYLNPGKRVERYYQDARVVTDEALSWLARHGDERWFLMVHYMDPHDPYFPHPADGTGYARVEHPHPDIAEAAAMRELYQGEVRYWDTEFARLLAELHRRDWFDDAAIVLTADHGEEFGEHGGFWHGNRLYDEALRVPLLLKPPEGSGRSPGRSPDVVRLMDVAPTLVELAGAPRPDPWQGQSLLREYELRAPDERLALAEADFEGFELQSVRDAEWTLIRNERSPPDVPGRPDRELFYRVDDPGERRDLARDGALAWAKERLFGDLERLHAASCAGTVPGGGAQAPLSPAECEALRSLGYVDGARCPTGR